MNFAMRAKVWARATGAFQNFGFLLKVLLQRTIGVRQQPDNRLRVPEESNEFL